jgi:hypothetical protein
MKTIDIGKNIYELTESYPEIIDILKDIGFKDLANPLMRKTAGKVMTLPKGCSMKGIDLGMVIRKLSENGFDARE